KETHGRVTETISWMIIGLEMLLMYYISVNAIDKEQKLKTMEIAVEKFEQIASKHSLNLKSHDPVLLFVECFRDLINSKSVSIIDINDDPYTDDRHFVGWEDKEFYYLILGNLIKEINSYLQGQNQRFPISKYMLAKLLAERQMIETERYENESRNIVRAYVGKDQKQSRVMKLKKSSVL